MKVLIGEEVEFEGKREIEEIEEEIASEEIDGEVEVEEDDGEDDDGDEEDEEDDDEDDVQEVFQTSDGGPPAQPVEDDDDDEDDEEEDEDDDGDDDGEDSDDDDDDEDGEDDEEDAPTEYSASAVREMVNNAVKDAVKDVHEEYAGQIAALQAQIEGKGKIVEPEREPFHTTLPEIRPELATASSQEIVSPFSRLEGKIDYLRTEMRYLIRTLGNTCQTTIDLLKRKHDNRDDPVRREGKVSKKVRLDPLALTGTSAGVVSAGTRVDTNDDVAISSDRDCGDGGQESPRNSGSLSFKDM